MTEDAADKPGVIALPPFIYLAFLLAGLGLEVIAPTALLAAPLRYFVGGALIAGGLALAVVASGRFRAAGTNVRPTLPATALVTDGPYRFTRNPMYVALTAVYLGLTLTADSLWLLILLPLLLAVMHYGVIRREERYLAGKFGTPYHDYVGRVRRWL